MHEQVTIVAAHGNGGGGLRFAAVHEHLPADVSLRAPTLPGFPDVPADPQLTTLAAYADVLAGHVAAAPRPRVLLGHGIGGSLALTALADGGVNVDGLILHAPVGTRLDTRWLPRLMRLPGATGLLAAVLASAPARPLLRRLAFVAPVDVDSARRLLAGYGRCPAFGHMFDLIDADWFARLPPLDVPAVLLWGGRERILGVDQLEDYTRLLPGADVAVVDGWDHFPMLDDPRGYADRIAGLARRLVTAR